MKTPSTNLRKTMRIIARVMSALIVCFALVMFIGEGMESSKRATPASMDMYTIIQLSIAGIGLLGLALAWKWEMAGGIICVLAFIVLFIVNTDALLLPMFIFPAIGILFIAVAYMEAESKKNISST